MNPRSSSFSPILDLHLRALALILLLAAASVSEAKPKFLDLFKATYNLDPSSALAAAKCGICHTNPPQRNAYGKELKKLIDASTDGELTVGMLKQVEGLDSDGDGWTNGDEIKQGFLPGDPANHPAGTATKGAKSPSSGATSAPNPTASSGSLIPSNGFHPIFIHFPIALFIFGVFLEFVGIWKKIPALGVAALWNLTGALASLAIVAPTGIAAWLVGGHKLEGSMLFHLLSAIGSLLLMSGTLVARKKMGNESKPYWTILILAAVVVGLTGYFGGQMVYG